MPARREILSETSSASQVVLSIIIVSWNTREILGHCLESVCSELADGNFASEVLVVDNASHDDTVQMIQQRFPWVKLIDNRENIGFARANNQGLQMCSGRYVLLLNPDTEVRSGALQSLVLFMEENPQVGMAGARILNPDETLQTSCYPEPELLRELWRLLYLDMLRPHGCYRMADWDLKVPREVDTVLGACMMLRREALDDVGLLDEEYFMYSEEIDLCLRLRRAGWSIYWVPQAEVIHYGGQSTQQVASEMFLRLYQGKILYFRKHHGRLAAEVYKFILLIAAFIRILLSPLTRLERIPERERHLALARNYWRLIVALPAM